MPTPLSISATLTSTLTDIYTVPAGKHALLDHILAATTTAGTLTVKRYQSSNTTAYKLIPAVDISAKGIKEAFQLRLLAGDKIQASAATTTDCDLTLSGIEDDL